MEQGTSSFNVLSGQAFIKRVTLDLALAAQNQGCSGKLLLGYMETFCGVAGDDNAAFLRVSFQPQAKDYAKECFSKGMKAAGFTTLPHGKTGTEFNLVPDNGRIEMTKMRHALRNIHALGLIPTELALRAATDFGVQKLRLDMESHERMTGEKWQTICDEGKGAILQRVNRVLHGKTLTRVRKADAAPQTLA